MMKILREEMTRKEGEKTGTKKKEDFDWIISLLTKLHKASYSFMSMEVELKKLIF
jgi:hypothetical protein